MNHRASILTLVVVALAAPARAGDPVDALDQNAIDITHAVSVSAGGLHNDGAVACSTCSTSSRDPGAGNLQDVQLGQARTIGHGFQGASAVQPEGVGDGSSKAGHAGATAKSSRATPPPGGQSLLPEKLRSLRWTVYERIGTMEHVNHYHGKALLTPGTGVAVGFTTGQHGNGHCTHVGTPAVPGSLDEKNGSFNSWISATAGGEPLSKDCMTLDGGDFGATTEYLATDEPNARPRGRWCVLKPSTVYYCNVAGRPGAVTSPLGVADWTPEEANADMEGNDCTYGTMRGKIHNGQCIGPNGETTPPPDNRPACTNQVVKLGGGCVTCASASPVSCAAPGNVLVGNCGDVCR